jgi:chromosome condensin MukBEF MukE localization factor
MPTASLTVLLKEHNVGMAAAVANKMLARAGMLEEMTRPSSKGTVKKFWSVTEASQKYGKNVTSPNNPKETQPHWYRDTFKELVRLHLVA